MSLLRLAVTRVRVWASLESAFLPPRLIETPIKNRRSVFLFADEILRQRLSLRETTLYRAVQSGDVVLRRIGRGGVVMRVASDKEFELYLSRFLALADSIERHGVLDIRHAPAIASSPGERNIKVLMLETGSLRHKSCGKHRLAIAKALDLPFIPVHLFFASPLAWWRFGRRGTPFRLHAQTKTEVMA